MRAEGALPGNAARRTPIAARWERSRWTRPDSIAWCKPSPSVHTGVPCSADSSPAWLAASRSPRRPAPSAAAVPSSASAGGATPARNRCFPTPWPRSPCYPDGPPCRNGSLCVPSGDPGEMRCACSGGFIPCGNKKSRACIDPRTDAANCGACGTVCPSGTACCAIGPIAPAECIDTDTDERHCGGCRRTCGAGEVCLGGSCQSQCRAGLTPCGGACVDLATDPANCGVCGNACGGLRPCANGTCGLPPSICVGGLTFCGGECVDTLRDPVNCGGCGRVCPAGRPCENGSCGGSVCIPEGRPCEGASQCCSGLTCDEGRCNETSGLRRSDRGRTSKGR